MRLVLVAVLLLLVLITGCEQNVPVITEAPQRDRVEYDPFPYSDEQGEQALEIAEYTWGDPCNGEETIRVAPQPEGKISAWTTAGDCHIYFNPDLLDYWEAKGYPAFCTVVVHELGHLAGAEHVADSDNVMYPYDDRRNLAACEY